MNRRAVVATHHKTGTAWMAKVFKAVALRLSVPLVMMHSKKVLSAPVSIPSIIFNNHSDFRGVDWLLQDPDTRIFHLIRDPRDVIISAMHYHKTAREPWLHKPRSRFNGMTYQQELNSLPDDRARLIWEMDNTGGRTINAMKAWDYSLEKSCEMKYEELIEDVDAVEFARVASHLGFDYNEVASCQEEFRRRSLFGRKRLPKSIHVRSGMSRQWESVYDLGLAQIFVEKFGTALIDLGYEPDNSWIGACRGVPG
jgi:Sulfotransferase domain